MTESSVRVEGTPNPNAAKFVVESGLLGDEGRSYFDAAEAADDPLAARLFQVAGVRALLMVDNFITVTKAETVEWDDIVEELKWIIEDVLAK